jgi:hypothetical protein
VPSVACPECVSVLVTQYFPGYFTVPQYLNTIAAINNSRERATDLQRGGWILEAIDLSVLNLRMRTEERLLWT